MLYSHFNVCKVSRHIGLGPGAKNNSVRYNTIIIIMFWVCRTRPSPDLVVNNTWFVCNILILMFLVFRSGSGAKNTWPRCHTIIIMFWMCRTRAWPDLDSTNTWFICNILILMFLKCLDTLGWARVLKFPGSGPILLLSCFECIRTRGLHPKSFNW